MKHKVYLAAPAYNVAQSGGTSKIRSLIEDSGFEVTDVLGEATFTVAWLDGFLPPGQVLLHAMGVTNQIPVNFPPEVQAYIDAGFHATGRARIPPGGRKAIVLPGEVEEVADSPKGVTLGLTSGTLLVTGVTRVNVPDSSVLIEVGMALEKGQVVVGLALAAPYIGPQSTHGLLVLTPSLDGLSELLTWMAGNEELLSNLAEQGSLSGKPFVNEIRQKANESLEVEGEEAGSEEVH